MQKIIFIMLIGFVLSVSLNDTAVLNAQNDPEAFRAKAPGAGEAPVIHIKDYEVFSLENGLKVILVENHKIPKVSYQLSLLHNPVLEGEKVGYVSIAGDLMGRGTKDHSKAELDESIDFIGARFNTNAYGMYGNSLTKHQEKLLDVFTEVLYNPSFPQAELDKIVKQMLTALAQAKQDPGSIAANVSSVVNFSKQHPYGEVETEESVKNVTVEDCIGYYKSYFRPDNAILTIVGDIDKPKAVKIVDKYFSKWENGSESLVNQSLKKVEMPQSTEVAFAQKDGAVQSQIDIVYPIDYPKGSPDAVKVSVMNTILGGGGFMGRLMQNLREDKAYTYGARSSISSDEHIGDFRASASVRNEVTDSAIVQFLFEMKRMIDEKVLEEDLSMAKSVLAGSFARSMESPQTIARFAYNTIRYNYPKDYYATYLQRLAAVTVDDIQAIAKKYIRPENAHIVVVGEKDDVAEKILKFDHDGELDYYDAFGNKIEMKSSDAPVGQTAEMVLKDYFAAIGGEEKLRNVKSMKMIASMNLMGQELEMTMIKKSSGKFYQKLGNENMTLQEQVFDGIQAKMSGMGGSQIITEGKELEAIKKEAKLFSELDLLSDDYSLELKGVEKMDGKDVYKLLSIDKNGNKESLYFDTESGLMVKKVSTQEARGQKVTVATQFSHYEAVNGIQFPKEISIVGGAPFPINMKFTTVELDGEVDDSIFEIK